MTNVAVLASGRGSNFRAMTVHEKLGIFKDVNIALLIYNHKDAGAKKIADKYEVSNELVDFYNRSRTEAEEKVLDEMKNYSIDLVCLAGWDQIIGSKMFNTYRWKLMSNHPSLHPSFAWKGLNARDVHREVLGSGVDLTGCTVFYVDKSVDRGPIILQQSVEVLEKQLFIQDQERAIDSLSDRVLMHEHLTYPKAIQLHAEKKLRVEMVKYGDEEVKENYIVVKDVNDKWEKDWERRQSTFRSYQRENMRDLYGSLA